MRFILITSQLQCLYLGTKEWESQSRDPLITKSVIYCYFLFCLLLNVAATCVSRQTAHKLCVRSSIRYVTSVFTITFERKIPPSYQETRFMQHSWYCRQMKILNASILFTIAVSCNSNLKLSQSRDSLSKGTWLIQRSNHFLLFLSQSANRFPQLERFISMRACTLHALNTTARANSGVLEIFIREVTINPCVSSALKIHSQRE